MKYSEVNKPKQIKEKQLRIWHIPQVPMHAFYVYVDSIKEAKQMLEVLAIYDLFQLEYKIKSDYSNVSGLEVYQDNEWFEYEDEEGNNIDDIEIES